MEERLAGFLERLARLGEDNDAREVARSKRMLNITRSTGRLLNEDWLTRALPRFYEYDLQRGLDVAARVARRLNRSVRESPSRRCAAAR